jgi:hypothetical protein
VAPISDSPHNTHEPLWPLPTADAGEFLGRTLRTRHAVRKEDTVTVLHVRWSLGCRLRRRKFPQALRYTFTTPRTRIGLSPRPSRRGFTLGTIKQVFQARKGDSTPGGQSVRRGVRSSRRLYRSAREWVSTLIPVEQDARVESDNRVARSLPTPDSCRRVLENAYKDCRHYIVDTCAWLGYTHVCMVLAIVAGQWPPR